MGQVHKYSCLQEDKNEKKWHYVQRLSKIQSAQYERTKKKNKCYKNVDKGDEGRSHERRTGKE